MLGKHALAPSAVQARTPAPLLAPLSAASVAQLGLAYLATAPETAQQDHDDLYTRQQLYQQAIDDPASTSKHSLVRAVCDDWKDGLSYAQVAQLDIQLFQEKGTGKTWSAYRANLAASGAVPAANQLFQRFRQAFGAFHPHYLHLSTLSSPHPVTLLRIQLLPSSSSSTSSSSASAHPPAHLLLHFPDTPFFLLPSSLTAALKPLVLHSLELALASPAVAPPELDKVDLEGRDWASLRQCLLASMARQQGRAGGADAAPRRRRASPPPTPLPLHPLTNVPLLPSPTAKRTRAIKRRRVEAAREAFHLPRNGEAGGGTEDEDSLPVLDKLEYELHLPYPSSSSPPPSEPSPSNLSQQHHQPPFHLRLTGTHVLAGLRALVREGYIDPTPTPASAQEGKGGGGMPRWLSGGVQEEGVNRMKVGLREGGGGVGRI
ncbi:uncharacterized protein JCM10292_002777 [Rhodotorula paludigena]|uniref:uncharacterized protein n=1 Tax=Rhodotorula paludigena TaxID=86838 RepID=UPI00316EF9D1